ncbi:hypothetical protein MMPV_001650 [Pyropia vietnamensis]
MLLGDSGSIWSALAPYASAPDHELAPSPRLDAALHALVAVLQGASVPPAVLAAASCSLAAPGQDGVLAARAADVRDVAQRAEGELERAYAGIILSRLGSGAAAEVTAQDDAGVPREGWPDGFPPPAVVALAAASRPFPYVDHYVRLVAAEAAALSAVIPERSLSGKEAGTAPGLRLAFCGSGPLPLTGCLLAAAGAAASVTLIDIDPSAVAVSSRLLDLWTAAGALRGGSVSVLCADATRVAFAVDPESVAARSPPPDTIARVAADVVFVAALLPTAAKTAIAARMAAAASIGPPAAATPVMAVRTAHGLTADLTYEASGRATLSRLLPFVGVVVPRTHEAPVAAAAASGGGVRGEDPDEVLGWFPSEVLNSMELYGGGRGRGARPADRCADCAGQAAVLTAGRTGGMSHE